MPSQSNWHALRTGSPFFRHRDREGQVDYTNPGNRCKLAFARFWRCPARWSTRFTQPIHIQLRPWPTQWEDSQGRCMSTSRRDFLKSSIIAGAGVALSGPTASASAAASSAPRENAFAATVDAMKGGVGYTRGVGMYPGAPDENFSPELVIDNTTYRNLALLRPAYHSSSYDYNLTAQLVTDGIKDTTLPAWVSTAISLRGTLPKSEREIFLDHFHDSSIEIHGAR